MPRMSRHAVSAALLMMVGAPFRTGAQDVHELERRLDAEVIVRDRASADLAAYHRLAPPPRVFPDTVAIMGGAVLLVTTHEFLPLVRDAASLTEAFLVPRAAAGVSTLRGTVFAIFTDSIRRAEHGLIFSPRVNGREVNEHYLVAGASSLADRLEMHLQERIGMTGRPLVVAWLGAPLPIMPASNAEWRTLRLELVSSPSSVAHRCFAGSLPACKVTLGLVEEADPATAWYDALTRRQLVMAATKEGILERRFAAACLAGRDSACVTLVRTNQALAKWLTPPGTARARRTLVQQAFAMGPAGALARLARSSDLPPDALGAIAGAPVDSLVSQWQRHAHDGGIESESATPVVALGALGWILAMGALSLRSPRWR